MTELSKNPGGKIPFNSPFHGLNKSLERQNEEFDENHFKEEALKAKKKERETGSLIGLDPDTIINREAVKKEDNTSI